MSDIKQKTPEMVVNKTRIIKVVNLNKQDKPDTIKWFKILASGFLVGFLFLVLFTSSHVSFALGFVIGVVLSYNYDKFGIHQKLAKLFKKVGVSPFIGIGVYFVWFSYWMVYSGTWLNDVYWIQEMVDPAETPSSFAVSYAASALDSLVFFLFVGLVLAIIALKKPEEEKLNRKIEYIFPDIEPESHLASYLVDRVSSLACVNKLSERELTITDISDDNRFIKISVKSHSVIKNIHNNTQFANDKMPWFFNVDVDMPSEKILGEIHELSMLYKIGDSSKEKHIIKGIEQLTSNNRSYNTTFPVELDPGQEIIYQANCWAWESSGKEFNFNISRYTELQRFNILNATNKDIVLMVETENKKTGKKESNPFVLAKPEETDSEIKCFDHVAEYKDLCSDNTVTLKFSVKE